MTTLELLNAVDCLSDGQRQDVYARIGQAAATLPDSAEEVAYVNAICNIVKEFIA